MNVFLVISNLLALSVMMLRCNQNQEETEPTLEEDVT